MIKINQKHEHQHDLIEIVPLLFRLNDSTIYSIQNPIQSIIKLREKEVVVKCYGVTSLLKNNAFSKHITRFWKYFCFQKLYATAAYARMLNTNEQTSVNRVLCYREKWQMHFSKNHTMEFSLD